MSALFPHDPDVEMTHHQGAENTELRSVHVGKWVGAPVCYTIHRAAAVAYCRCHEEPAGTTQHRTQRIETNEIYIVGNFGGTLSRGYVRTAPIHRTIGIRQD